MKFSVFDLDELFNGLLFEYKIFNGMVEGNFYIELSLKISIIVDIYLLVLY